jgi:methionyl-tRNA formyltransferase
MKIVIIGQSAFGRSVMEAIADAGKDEIVGAFPPADREGRPLDPVKEGALERSIPVHQHGKYRSEESIAAFKALDADLCVMAFVTDIVPDDMIEAPKLGTIQYHPSLLPKHRGPSSINWPIIQGETMTGLTIFWPDKGLDTGPVLLQKETEIGPDDTLGSLYFDRLYPMGVEGMVEAIDMVRDGTAPRIVQDESQATYESWAKSEVGVVDWSQPVATVYNLIRGCNPQPGASTTRGGETVKLFDAERRDGDADAAPGTVTDISDAGVSVAALGGQILLKRVQPPESRKVTAREWADEAGLQVGEVLGG